MRESSNSKIFFKFLLINDCMMRVHTANPKLLNSEKNNFLIIFKEILSVLPCGEVELWLCNLDVLQHLILNAALQQSAVQKSPNGWNRHVLPAVY